MSWAIACERATSQPLQHLLDKLYAASAVTVACFVLCAAASAVLHVSWRCIPSGDRSHVWKLYGPFTAFSCIGCCAGACAWACHMQSHVFLYQSSTNGTEPQDTQYKLQAQVEAARWDAAFNILYPFEFIFISLVKIMVLDRMLDFALSKMGPHSALQRAKTAFLGLLLAGITAGLAANITSAVYRIQNANFVTSAAAAITNQTTVDSLLLDASSIMKHVDFAGSIQQFCEVCVLFCIIVAFAVSAVVASRRISTSLRRMSLIESNASAPAVRTLRKQIVGTSVFVFVSFIIRAVWAIMFALSNSLSATSTPCAKRLCDASCANNWALLQTWITFTPEFRIGIIFISSPLCLLVALWGMTSSRARASMRSSIKMRTRTTGKRASSNAQTRRVTTDV